jgi:CO/xanthine dehydrogenase Mo-binding subunit
MLARILNLPINKVRMIMSPVGGGFGGKEDMIYQGMLALLAIKTRRPVRLVFTREESIATTAKRHPSRTRYKMGLTRDGIILASEIRIVYDGGAYGMSTEGVIRKGAILAGGPYNVPNIRIDTYGVYTNNTPSGAFRSFGSLQSQFATESHLDICAERLGIDPFELRLKNAMRKGDRTHTKQPLNSSSMSQVLEAARGASRWETGAPTVRGPERGDLGGPGTRPACTLVPRELIDPAAAPLPARKGAA